MQPKAIPGKRWHVERAGSGVNNACSRALLISVMVCSPNEKDGLREFYTSQVMSSRQLGHGIYEKAKLVGWSW